jgi:predicted nucleic acid-binding protein
VRRIVADTNVYISALNFAGTPDEVLTLGRVGAIVTGDQHLLKLKRFRDIVILSPREFLLAR